MNKKFYLPYLYRFYYFDDWHCSQEESEGDDYEGEGSEEEEDEDIEEEESFAADADTTEDTNEDGKRYFTFTYYISMA